MKNSILLVLILAIGFISLKTNAQTTVCGNVSGVWEASGNPFHLTCDVTVLPGATLVIQPGVTIQGDQNVDFIVQGRLLATGTQDSIISFTSSDTINGWGGIEFHNSANDDSEILYAKIDYALAGIYISEAFPTLGNLEISNNTTGIFGAFTPNSDPTSVQLFNLNIHNNNIGFLQDGRFQSVIKDSRIFNNETGALLIDQTNAPDFPRFERCLICNNEIGFQVIGDRKRPRIISCTITDNSSSEMLLDGTVDVIVENSIVWGGDFEDGIVLVDNALVDASYSDISLFTGIWPGNGNIKDEPLFVDPDNKDYSLTCLSPCINTGNPDSLDIDGTIIEMGAIPFDFSSIPGSTSNDSPVCEGGQVTLMAEGGVSYNWSGANGFTSTNQNPILSSVTTDMAGEYSVTITTSDGCIIELSTEVIINSLPTAEIDGDFEFCEGESTTLTANGGTAYDWSTGDDTASITADAANDYTVTVTDDNGCTDTETVMVTSNPLPSAGIDGDLEFCEGENTTLTANGGTAYDWSTGDDTASITADAANDYTVTVTDDNGCTDTETVTVTSNPLPTAGIDGDLEFCEGESTTLTANGGTTYDWSTGDNTVSITATTTNDYTVTVTDDNGCTDAETVSVISNPLPTAGINGNLAFCEGESTILTANGGTTYDWSTGDNTASITITNADNYTVTVTDDNGCTDTETVTVTSNPLPTVNFELDRDTFCIDETNIDLSGGTPAGGIYSGSGVSGNNFDPSVAGIGTHILTYTFTDTDGCTNSDTHEIIVEDGECVTGVNSIEFRKLVKIFPNPSDGNFMILLEGWVGELKIHLFDIQGRMIYSEESNLNQIHIRDLPKGIFLLKLSTDDFFTTKRLIVH